MQVQYIYSIEEHQRLFDVYLHALSEQRKAEEFAEREGTGAAEAAAEERGQQTEKALLAESEYGEKCLDEILRIDKEKQEKSSAEIERLIQEGRETGKRIDKLLEESRKLNEVDPVKAKEKQERDEQNRILDKRREESEIRQAKLDEEIAQKRAKNAILLEQVAQARLGSSPVETPAPMPITDHNVTVVTSPKEDSTTSKVEIVAEENLNIVQRFFKRVSEFFFNLFSHFFSGRNVTHVK